MNLAYFAIGFFALSAIFGLTILIKWISNSGASKAVVYSHGILAALGLGALVVYALQNPSNYPKASLILLAVAAVAGFYMFFRDLQKKNSPLAIAIIHALVAVSGVVALLVFILA